MEYRVRVHALCISLMIYFSSDINALRLASPSAIEAFCLYKEALKTVMSYDPKEVGTWSLGVFEGKQLVGHIDYHYEPNAKGWYYEVGFDKINLTASEEALALFDIIEQYINSDIGYDFERPVPLDLKLYRDIHPTVQAIGNPTIHIYYSRGKKNAPKETTKENTGNTLTR